MTKKSSQIAAWIAGVCLIWLIAAVPRSAQAHTVYQFGEYSVVAAWEIEPPVVGERNSIDIIITRDGEAVPTADLSLAVELTIGSAAKPVLAAPEVREVTMYKVTFIPTQAGEFGVHLRGRIGEEVVDETVFAEPVTAADILQFPSITLGSAELQAAMIQIETAAAVANQRATIGIAIGGVGIVTGVVGILLGRRR